GLKVLRNEGARLFSTPRDGSTLWINLSHLYVIDANSDGIPDLAGVTQFDHPTNIENLVVYLGQGDCTFASPITTPLGVGINSYERNSTFIDLNGDQILDAVVSYGGDDIVTLLGNGDGSFRIASRVSS